MFLTVLCLSASCPCPHGLDGTAVPNLMCRGSVHVQSSTPHPGRHSPSVSGWRWGRLSSLNPFSQLGTSLRFMSCSSCTPWDTGLGDSLLLLLQEAAELLSGQVHEPIHLLLGAFEVLNAEGINCHLPNAQVQAPPQGLQETKYNNWVSKSQLLHVKPSCGSPPGSQEITVKKM